MGSNTIGLLGLAAAPDSPSAQACRRLIEFFRPYQAKELARIFNCSPRTAESWKQGSWPGSRHEHAIVAHFGRAWLDFVYAPLLPTEDRALSAQLTEIEGRLAAVRLAMETLEGEGGNDALGGIAKPLCAQAQAQRVAPRSAAAAAGGRAGHPGTRLGRLGTGTGALALVLMVVLSGVPEHSKAVRTFRGAGTGRVVRVLRDLELV